MSSNGVDNTDLDRTEKNIEWARQYLGKSWAVIMRLRGRDYQLPLVMNGARTAFSSVPWRCNGGTIHQLDNAQYCSADNVISYDGFFLAGLAKKVGQQNHSSGDFAAMMAIAHENGHALQYQLGITNMFVFANEQNADCFAGATAHQMKLDGVLHPADIPEAKKALALLADEKQASLFDNNAHGDSTQRIVAFTAGFDGGAAACAPLPTPWRPPAGKY